MERAPLCASLCTGPGAQAPWHGCGAAAGISLQSGRACRDRLGRAQLQAGSHLTQAGNPGTHHSHSPRLSWVCLPSQACFSCNLSFGSQPLSPCSRLPHSPPPQVGSFPPGPWPLELKLLSPTFLTPPKHHLDSSNKLTEWGTLHLPSTWLSSVGQTSRFLRLALSLCKGLMPIWASLGLSYP